MITYKTTIDVFLDGEFKGKIRPVSFTSGTGCGPTAWRYFPKGQKYGGEKFDTIEEVKKSLEG